MNRFKFPTGGLRRKSAALKKQVEELQKSEFLLRIQHDLTLRLSGLDRLDEILRVCLDTALRISDMDGGGIYLAEESGEWILAIHHGLGQDFVDRSSRYAAGSANVQFLASGKPIYINYQTAKLPIDTAAKKPEGLRAAALIPIPYRDRIIACLNVASHRIETITPLAVMALETIAGQMGQSIVRARAQVSLGKSEWRLRNLTENLALGVYRSRAEGDGRFVEINPAAVTILGYSSRDELLNVRVVDIYNSPANRLHFLDKLDILGFVRGWEIPMRRKDGTVFTCSVSAVAVRDSDGRIEFIDGILEDVSERRAGEEALKKSERTYRALFEQSNDIVTLFDLDGLTIDANPAAVALLGRSKDELIGRHFFDQIAESEREDAMNKFRAALGGAAIPSYTRIARRPDGTEFSAEVHLLLVRDPEGRPLFLQSISRDISERKQAEDRIRAALNEKEVLLREIHHRVKNNMQVIISLLRLQSRTIDEPRGLEIFKTTQDRIRSMALVHEKLYHSADLAGIDFRGYILSLVPHLVASVGLDPGRVQVEYDLTEIELDINKAVPCGLILNELVTNALKHAFPSGRAGTIRVRLARDGGRTRLVVADDGIGLPPTVDLSRPAGLGLQIVIDLAKQIDAEMAVDRTAGTAFSFLF